MLKIGFATEYYTLWDISKEVQYGTNSRGEHYASHEKVSYYYMQNLSKDEAKAKEKAKALGCTNLEPDEELYGRNRSFFKEVKLNSPLPKNINPFFTFGKYSDNEILACTDINYLFWYFKETNNRYAKQVLLENGYTEFEGNVYSEEEYERVLAGLEKSRLRDEFIKKFDDNKQLEFTFTLNTNPNHNGVARTTLPLDVLFEETKEMYYNGYDYFLPVINGKAKKLKGKEITAIVELTKIEDYGDGIFLKFINLK